MLPIPHRTQLHKHPSLFPKCFYFFFIYCRALRFQGAARKFDKAELDQICVTLAGGKRLFNPHRNVFGLGNYDVNVLGFAVQSRGFELSWHDARKTTKDVDLDQYFAIIVNKRSAAKWYRFGQSVARCFSFFCAPTFIKLAKQTKHC